MAVQVVMPALGRSRETGRVVRWHRREGELVAAGEPLLEVETGMAIVVVEAPGAGVLSGVLVREGDAVRAGMVLAYLLAPAARPSAAPPAGFPPAAGPRPGRREATGREATGREGTGAGPALSDGGRAMGDGVG